MNILNEIQSLDENEEIMILIREPGIYETYVDYCLLSDKEKIKRLTKKKTERDLLPEFLVKDFIEYRKGRELLLQIHRENKILQFG